MRFRGTEADCREAIADVDAMRGYPRRFAESDIGVAIFREGGGRHVPVERLITQTVATPRPVDVDADGEPASDVREIGVPRPSGAERGIIARWRLVRWLNRAEPRKLVRITGIGPVAAAAIIGARARGRITSVADLADVLNARALQALRDHRDEMRAIDVDDTEDETMPTRPGDGAPT